MFELVAVSKSEKVVFFFADNRTTNITSQDWHKIDVIIISFKTFCELAWGHLNFHLLRRKYSHQKKNQTQQLTI